MSKVRRAAVAGLFYPADPDELRTMIVRLLAAADGDGPTPKALVLPHAGYIYSGAIAASGYARLGAARNSIQRVVVLGPAHRIGFRGLAVSTADQFMTPLGNVPVDRAAVEDILTLSQVRTLDEAHAQEHSLEVHLPFLQECLGDFTVVPVVVGEASAEEVDAVLERLWGGAETLIIISSDLSHYHSYDAARQLDRATSRAIEELRTQDIDYEDACGRAPLNGLLLAARKHGLHGKTVDLRNSGDTAGGRERVVGYGAYVFR